MMDFKSMSLKRTDNESGRDLISDLPLGIIHMILALVPTQDAIRTSVLSKQWRYTWVTLPQLAFYSNGDKLYHDNEDRLINFINCALRLHKGPIHKFKLSARFKNKCPLIDEWLLRMSKNDVRELDLSLGPWDVPSSLYSFQKLTHLTVSGFELDPPPPSFKGFSCLKSLTLDVYGTSDAIESIVNSAHLLEKLILNVNSESLVLRISAPNVTFLRINGIFEKIFVYAPQVVKMSVVLLDIDQDYTAEHESSGCNYVNLLSSCNKLESLDLYNLTWYLTIGIESYHSSLVFHHLKLIQLDNVSFMDLIEISAVLQLIMESPNLHKLVISAYFFEAREFEAAHDIPIWDSKCVPSFTFEKLKIVEMKEVRGFPNEMEFIRFLLKSSPMLEMMTIEHSFYADCTEAWSSSMAELVRYGQVESPNVEILFKQGKNPF